MFSKKLQRRSKEIFVNRDRFKTEHEAVKEMQNKGYQSQLDNKSNKNLYRFKQTDYEPVILGKDGHGQRQDYSSHYTQPDNYVYRDKGIQQIIQPRPQGYQQTYQKIIKQRSNMPK